MIVGENKSIDGSHFYRTYLILCGYLLALKSLSVAFYSSRGIAKGWPFDSFLFVTVERFTDYLIPYYTAGYENMYNPMEWESKGLALAPYGHLQYVLLRYLPWRHTQLITYGNYLLVLSVTIVMIWMLIRKTRVMTSVNAHLVMPALLVTFFPLHYLIDRGNLDIYGLILILSMSHALWNYDAKKATHLYALLTALLICLKPSFALFFVPLVLAGSAFQILCASVVIAFNYLIPSLFYGASFNYIIDYINEAAPYTKGASLFCHSIPCSLDEIGVGYPDVLPFFLLGLFLLVVIWIRWKVRTLENQTKLKLLFTTTIFGTLLINPQSWDYRLTFLLPVFIIVIPEITSASMAKRFPYAGLAAGATGYVNILIPGVLAYDVLIRCTCLCALASLVVRDWLQVLLHPASSSEQQSTLILDSSE